MNSRQEWVDNYGDVYQIKCSSTRPDGSWRAPLFQMTIITGHGHFNRRTWNIMLSHNQTKCVQAIPLTDDFMLQGLTCAPQASCLHFVSSSSRLDQTTRIVAPLMSCPSNSSSKSTGGEVIFYESLSWINTWNFLTWLLTAGTWPLGWLPLRARRVRNLQLKTGKVASK